MCWEQVILIHGCLRWIALIFCSSLTSHYKFDISHDENIYTWGIGKHIFVCESCVSMYVCVCLYVCLCTCICGYASHSMYIEVKGQLVGVSSLLSYRIRLHTKTFVSQRAGG